MELLASNPMIPDIALKLIKKFEGLFLVPYRCSANVLTIGYGCTRINGRSVRQGDRLENEAEAERILIDQLQRNYIPKLKIIPGWDEMTNNQRSALMSFAWNLGAHFYGSVGFETITKHLKAKEWEHIPRVLGLYVKAGGKTLPGLVRRRKEEGDLWIKSEVEEGCLGLEERNRVF